MADTDFEEEGSTAGTSSLGVNEGLVGRMEGKRGVVGEGGTNLVLVNW